MLYYIRALNEHQSIMVQENKEQQVIHEGVLSLLEQLCLFHGATYEGRRDAAAKILHIVQKVPILVSEITRDMLFPTKAVKEADCIWINYRAVDEIVRTRGKTLLYFHDGTFLQLSIDPRSLKRSLSLCRQFNDFLDMVR